jgi:ketosteroid isomerase-like protein
MGSGNVELARAAYAALSRDDIDEFIAFAHPDVEWHSLLLEMEGTIHGHDGVRRWWESIQTAFPDWRPVLTDIEAHGDWVLMHVKATGSGAASGVGIAGDFWQVVEFRDGLVVQHHSVRSRDEALRILAPE